MSIMDYLIEILNSSLFYYLFLASAVCLIIAGVLLFIGIKTKGKVLIIDSLFKKKHFDREKLKNRYIIQAIYTTVIGIGLLIILLTMPYNGVTLFLWMIVFAVLDGAYDFFAIKSSSKNNLESVQ